MKPQYLPRPYGWEVFHRKNDPNNPYNLIQGQPIEPQAPVHRSQDDRNDPQPSREQPVSQALGSRALEFTERLCAGGPPGETGGRDRL